MSRSLRRLHGLAAPLRALLLCAVFGATAGQAPGQVVLNEFLAANRYSSFDEEGDSEDWVEIYNPGLSPVNLEGYALSDDLEDLRQWVFPAVTVPPRGYLVVWLSGKDRFVPPPEAISSGIMDLAFEAKFIETETSWKYLVADREQPGPPAGWSEIGFDDSAFLEGSSGFGYGDGDDATEVPAGTNAVFARKVFNVPDPSRLKNLILQIDYDDGFVAYLNGRRVASANAPAGDPDFSSFSAGSHEAGNAQRFDLTPSVGLLVPGSNVLAVVGLNVGLTSSDMTLRPELGIVPLILHTNFSLEQEGETLVLVDPGGRVIDGTGFPEQTEDHSYGRVPQEGDAWFYLLTPTPGAPNETARFTEPISSEVACEPTAGMYTGAVDVTMSASPAGLTRIRYTTDGSAPTATSRLYFAPLRITENTVLRLAGFIQGERATRVVSRSYFINNPMQLPILSISMNPEDYAAVHNTSGGRGRAWERPAFLEYFDEQHHLAAATGMGLRLHGGAGRGGDFETKKAYKVYFRGIYGDKKLHCRIIPGTPVEVFDKLVLRSGFNDCFRTNGRAAYIRDQLIRDLHEEMGSLVSHGSWCMLYVNMKFRGLYNVVERMDEEFLSSYFDGDDWDVIKTGNDVLVGTRDEWERLHTAMVTGDLADDAVFDQAAQLLDLENFTSYMTLNMWAQNHDWPHNNWYAARERVPGAKWILLSWDAEFGVGLIPSGYSADSFEFTLGRNGYIREIFESLLKNESYREYFMRELDRFLRGTLSSRNVLDHINRLAAAVQPDIEYELQLFGRSVNDWQSNVAAMRTFAQYRGSTFRNYVEGSSRYDFPIIRTPVIYSVSPSSVVNTGDIELTITGSRLSTKTRLLFNGVEAEETSGTFAFQVHAVLPFDEAVSGPVTITAINPETGDAADYEGLLEVDLPVPRVVDLSPPDGSAAGGERVRIHGDYFLEGVQVFFGDVAAPDVVRVGGSMGELEVVTPPGRGIIPVRVVNARPRELAAEETLPFTYAGTPFIRGDVNVDGTVDISDPVNLLGHLFLEGGEIPCEAAADGNASGSLDLSDAVYILAFLFQGGAAPPAPHPECGFEPLPSALSCAAGPSCPANP